MDSTLGVVGVNGGGSDGDTVEASTGVIERKGDGVMGLGREVQLKESD